MSTKYVCPECIGYGVAAGIRCRRCGGSGAWYPVIREHNQRGTLASRCHRADVYAWPIEDVRRVLAAWPGEKK